MIAIRERSILATLANDILALGWGASAIGEPAVLMLATGGRGGSTTSAESSGGRGAAAGGCTSGGAKLNREPASTGRMLYSGLSVLVHGLPAIPKMVIC